MKKKIIVVLLVILIFTMFGITAGVFLNSRDPNTNVVTVVSDIDSRETVVEFEKQPVNTVELEFESEQMARVTISADGEVIYDRTSNDLYRFCAFETIETDSLNITVEGNVEKLKLSYKTCTDQDFRVTSYFVADTIQDEGSVNPECFDVVTDAIIFGCVTFDEQGIISVDDKKLENALTNVRSAIGEKDVNVYFNVLGPGSDEGISDWNEQMNNQAQKHSKAFKSDKLEKGFADLAEKYNFDGIFFDYEYPIEKKYWRDFNKFIVSLDSQTDIKIGLAVAQWDLGLNYKGRKAVDMLEFMQYDLFDAQGNHSSFSTAVSAYNAAKDKNIDLEKIDLGVPFYGRPSDSGAFWPTYKDYAEVLKQNNDVCETEYGEAYFNSCQTVYDKTAYAMSRGFGGMMVWHYFCDVEDVNSDLSLFGTMKECISDRKK